MRILDCKERLRAFAPLHMAALALMAIAVAVLPQRIAGQVSTTTVQGTVYRADGTPASGTLLLSWSAFTTPLNQAVAAGNLNAPIGADGFLSVNLTPNAAALPTGSYYTATYHLSDGTVNQEYWVVPDSSTASIASVRAQLEPSTIAVKPVSKAYVDSAINSLGSSWLPLAGGTLLGPLVLSADPSASSQAATKHYADQLAAANLPLSGGTVSGQYGQNVVNPPIPPGSNPVIQQSAARSSQAKWNGEPAYNYPYPEDFVDQLTALNTAPGFDLGGGLPSQFPVGWREFIPHNDSFSNTTQGQLINWSFMTQSSLGDFKGEYESLISYLGCQAPTDECAGVHAGGLSEATTTPTGTVTVISTAANGDTTLSASWTNLFGQGGAGPGIGAGRQILDTSKVSVAGTVTAHTAATGETPEIYAATVGSGSISASTAVGTLNAYCGPSSTTQLAGAQTVTVSCAATVTSGTFATGQTIALAGNRVEFEKIASVSTSGGVATITFPVRYGHESGSWVVQGGTQGCFVSTANEGNGTLLYPILTVGAPDTAHLWTMPDAYGSTAGNPFGQGEFSSYSGPFGNGGSQAITVYPCAEVLDVQDVQSNFALDGNNLTLGVFAGGTPVVGDTVNNTHMADFHFEGYRLDLGFSNPGAMSGDDLGGWFAFAANMGGSGLHGTGYGNFYGYEGMMDSAYVASNSNSSSIYSPFNGQPYSLYAPGFLRSVGVFDAALEMKTLPVHGIFWFGQPANNSTATIPIWTLTNYNGTANHQIIYNPQTNTVAHNSPETFSNAADTFAGQSGSFRAVTGATINSEFTVDGLAYTTLNAAWTAAANLATSTGQSQTVQLGPGTYPVTATLTEPSNGACVNLLGSAGTTLTADSTQIATTLTVPSSLSGDVVFLGNTAQAQGCTFKDLNILAAGNATHGFELQWFRGVLLDNVTVNDTTAEGILLGEENTASGHQANFTLRNVTVSYSSSAFTPANRSAYGVHLEKTAIDSHLDNIIVRNALTAAVYNEGTGNTGYLIHGFGYPYTCTTAPCVNNASSGSAANASYATSYVIYDAGGSGSTWTDTYADSPAVAGFYIGANGTEIHGGHIQWPDTTSFPAANFAYVAASVTNNLLIADVDCLTMSTAANWITFAGTAGNPPTFASIHHLTGCGNYYQSLEDAEVTGFSSGGANVNDASGATPRVWSTPVSSGSNYPAYAAQMYTGDQGDAFQAHFSGANPFFNITYQGTIRSNGGIALSTVINTASTLTLTAANKNVVANAASGAQTLTLPSCYTPLLDKASPTGLEFTIIKSDTSSNTVTLVTTGSQLIYSQGTSATSLVLSSPSAQNLVCGPDYNWYVSGSANATLSGNSVASFNGRTGAVTPAANDYSFAQLSGQATNAQLPATLTAATTGNATTATALATTPSGCAAGSYATGVSANGTAVCSTSWHFTWTPMIMGSFGGSASTAIGGAWEPSASIKLTRMDVFLGTTMAGCTTFPTIGVYDYTASAWISTVTLNYNSTSHFYNAVSGTVPAGHNIGIGVQTADAGCTTQPAYPQITVEYTMNQ